MRSWMIAAACGVVLGCGGSPVDATAAVKAHDAMTACDVPDARQPVDLTTCEADCYPPAICIEITGRLLYPQPGEADGGTLYSNLDVCLASCASQ